MAAGSPLAAAQEAIENDFGNWDPVGPSDMIGFFGGLPEFFDAFAKAVSGAAAKTQDGLPLHPAVAEKMNELAGHIAGLRDTAEELNGTFRQAHEPEIQRVENPRTGEETWDVGADR